MNFFRFFNHFLLIWPSNDLEPELTGSNWPQTQRAKKRIPTMVKFLVNKFFFFVGLSYVSIHASIFQNNWHNINFMGFFEWIWTLNYKRTNQNCPNAKFCHYWNYPFWLSTGYMKLPDLDKVWEILSFYGFLVMYYETSTALCAVISIGYFQCYVTMLFIWYILSSTLTSQPCICLSLTHALLW